MYGTEHRYAPRRIRILHVDDDRAFLDVTESFLTRELPSAEIATVQHPDAAIERLRAESFDCVISDYEMPDTDGLELLSQVRDWSDDLPFLLYTVKGSESIASRGRAVPNNTNGWRTASSTRSGSTTPGSTRSDTPRFRGPAGMGYPTYVVDADGGARFEFAGVEPPTEAVDPVDSAT
jgi:CheY-like chemotaxis protein